MQMFKNTINNAVNLVKTSGVDAQYQERSYDWGEEFVIVIKIDST